MTSQKIINRTKQQALHFPANFYRSLFSLFILPLVFPSLQIYIINNKKVHLIAFIN